MKKLFVAIFLFITFTAFSQTEIKVSEASKHIGDSVKICSVVAGGKYLSNSKDKPTFLDFGGKYPDNPLTIIISDEVRSQLGVAPEQTYKGRNICVTGKIESYKGKPELVIKNKNQIISVGK